ncbi:hypothetical protein [Kingella sp. (in: b-proteobacteria)]|uniref:hypothetical protein n=1 Tax=Kingella sp. (in: b-proteobacteria) TaxID=2020713 RepID=UPI0026DDC818|nr:hypothetical protein [Kingella sp. (in: b-proteobacteria)]MDO4656216.1 hypothetical protein [Kingella sp. (in: b-proteobacteria)]
MVASNNTKGSLKTRFPHFQAAFHPISPPLKEGSLKPHHTFQAAYPYFFARPRRASRRTHAGNICRRPALPARAPSIPPQPNNKGSLKTMNPIFRLPFIAPHRR